MGISLAEPRSQPSYRVARGRIWPKKASRTLLAAEERRQVPQFTVSAAVLSGKDRIPPEEEGTRVW